MLDGEDDGRDGVLGASGVLDGEDDRDSDEMCRARGRRNRPFRESTRNQRGIAIKRDLEEQEVDGIEATELFKQQWGDGAPKRR